LTDKKGFFKKFQERNSDLQEIFLFPGGIGRNIYEQIVTLTHTHTHTHAHANSINFFVFLNLSLNSRRGERERERIYKCDVG
jgi:Fe-S cluster biosynthesis and repair protein YggX